MWKKERVMIACVTTETVRISDAAKYFDVDRIHIVHYVDDHKEMTWFYKSFYEQVCKLINESLPECQIVEHNSMVFYFDNMLREIEHIVELENSSSVQPIIYVNISAGSPEYISAATIISMMHENTEPVSVGAGEYLHKKEEDLRSIYYENNVPVGLIKTIREPRVVQQFTLSAPSKRLVIGLRILNKRINNELPLTSKAIVAEFKQNGIWERDPSANDQVYYNRDFIDKWLQQKWVE